MNTGSTQAQQLFSLGSRLTTQYQANRSDVSCFIKRHMTESCQTRKVVVPLNLVTCQASKKAVWHYSNVRAIQNRYRLVDVAA